MRAAGSFVTSFLSVSAMHRGSVAAPHFHRQRSRFLTVSHPPRRVSSVERRGLQARRQPPNVNEHASLYDNFKWPLRILRLFGFFPLHLDSNGSQWYLPVWTLGLICINIYLFAMKSLPAAQTFVFYFGYLHGFTVAALIALTKPLMSCLHLAIFVIKSSSQRAFWKRMNEYECMLRQRMGWHVCVTRQKRVFGGTIIAILIILHMLHTADCLKNGQKFVDFLTDLTGHAVPLITLWAMLPTLYFYLVYSILAEWCDRLYTESLFDENDGLVDPDIVTNEPIRWRHSLVTINMATNELIALMTLAGDTFGAWLLLTQFSSLAVLTFCITFLTQTDGYMTLPAHIIEMSTDQEINDGLLQLYYNVAWAGIQVCFAIVNIMIIDRYGVRLNETMRLLMPRLCRRVQVDEHLTNDDMNDAGFVVTSIQGVYYSQGYWGVTAWRFYLIERSGLLSMISLMGTYAAILSQMRDMTNNPVSMTTTVLGEETESLLLIK